jgi:hypothetical protein
MIQQEPTGQPHILALIRAGMTVIDRAGEEVGKVDMVYMGTVDVDPTQAVRRDTLDPQMLDATSLFDAPGEDLLVDPTGPFLTNDMVLPEASRRELLQEGFIRLTATDLPEDARYIHPGQIASVADENVQLHQAHEELAG